MVKSCLTVAVFRMECEVCGITVERPIYVRIEGTEMRTCGSCSKLGVLIRQPVQKKQVNFKKHVLPREEKIVEYIEDYGRAIKNARQAKNLTQEELGKIINEKMSVIARLESKKMIPSIELAKKIERALGIQLLEELQEEKVESSRMPAGELTLGDVIKLKRGKSE